MVELQANVACMRKKPAMKQVNTNTGTEVVWAQIRVEASNTAPHTSRLVRLENRNLMRNITQKLIAMPTKEA